jgi:hypothetical protein
MLTQYGVALVSVCVMYKAFPPFFYDVCELAANNSLPQAIGLAVASHGFSVYMEAVKWYDWAHCCLLDVYMHSVGLYGATNEHVETIMGDITTIHLWNASSASLEWVRKHGPQRPNCVYKIHTFSSDNVDDFVCSPLGDDYGVNQTQRSSCDQKFIPTGFLGKCVTKKLTFAFNDERLVMADFHTITEIKQPTKTLGVSVRMDKSEKEYSLPMPYNFDSMYRLTTDISATNNAKKVINLRSVYGTRMQLYQDLMALSVTQRMNRNWSDLCETLCMLMLLNGVESYVLLLMGVDLSVLEERVL